MSPLVRKKLRNDSIIFVKFENSGEYFFLQTSQVKRFQPMTSSTNESAENNLHSSLRIFFLIQSSALRKFPQ